MVGSGIQYPEKTYLGSWIQGSKRHRISDPQHCIQFNHSIVVVFVALAMYVACLRTRTIEKKFHTNIPFFVQDAAAYAPGGEVPVDKVEALQVLHAGGHLGRHVEEGGEAEGARGGGEEGRVLGQVGAQEPVEDPVLQVLQHQKVRH